MDESQLQNWVMVQGFCLVFLPIALICSYPIWMLFLGGIGMIAATYTLIFQPDFKSYQESDILDDDFLENI